MTTCIACGRELLAGSALRLAAEARRDVGPLALQEVPAMTYIQTDDPNDPCSLCVQWMTPEGGNVETYEDAERAVPFISPWKVAPRIYQYIHDDCQAAAFAVEVD